VLQDKVTPSSFGLFQKYELRPLPLQALGTWESHRLSNHHSLSLIGEKKGDTHVLQNLTKNPAFLLGFGLNHQDELCLLGGEVKGRKGGFRSKSLKPGEEGKGKDGEEPGAKAFHGFSFHRVRFP
jgi:hypothetical protein